mmetsp:Transcript_57109/g.140099  ORF Transcript_57109/g.140099 Transcript_57109/m.140099 type:complete len:507 (+) Transcript_57109:197-1717(+)
MLGSQLARNVAITGGAALLLLWYTVRRKRLREEEEKWPAYSEESALQNIRAITNKKTVCQWMLNATRKNGKYFRIRMLLPGEKVFVVTDVKMVRTVLSGNPELMGIEGFDKVPDGTKRFSAFTQGVPSILTKLTNGQGPVDGWSWARKSLSPAFSMRNLLKRLPTIQRRISTLEGIIRAHDARGEAIDCCEWMLRFSIDVLFSSMFNVDSDTLREDKEETLGTRALSLFRLATEEIFGKRSGNKLRKYMFWDPSMRQALRAIDELMDLMAEIQEDYRATHTPKEIQADTGIMAHLLRAPYPDERARTADTLIFVLAGHDTTGYTLSWLLVELGRHPHVLTTLQRELDKVNPSSGEWTGEMASRCPYLLNVIKEVMRLWPVTALGGMGRSSPTHELVCDDGKVIPRNAIVLYPFIAIGRNDIKDGDAFIPERWEDTRGPDAARLKEAYMPFGLGKRMCMGQSLAQLEIRLLVATLAQRFDLQLVSGPSPEYYLSLKPANAHIRMRPR